MDPASTPFPRTPWSSNPQPLRLQRWNHERLVQKTPWIAAPSHGDGGFDRIRPPSPRNFPSEPRGSSGVVESASPMIQCCARWVLIHLDGQQFQAQSKLMAGEKVKKFSYTAGLLHCLLTRSIRPEDLCHPKS